MNKLAEAYFHWLADQVRDGGGHHAHTYWDMLRILNDVEFIWKIPNDDNRLEDGLDLRLEFFDEQGVTEGRSKEAFGPCSILEVLVGISRRMAFVAGEAAEGWAWVLVENLRFHYFTDPLSVNDGAKIHELLYNLNWRLYEPDGTGGFFPLAWPNEDQRKVEIWYQMHAYVMEIHPEY
jgi:hypothetical protein